jgi:hypothetical protein
MDNTALWRKVKQLSDQLDELRKNEYPAYVQGTWTPVYTGFSVDPVQECTYTVIGRVCWLTVGLWSVAGTSNATGFTITAPFTAPFAAAVAPITYFPVRFMDNGVTSPTPGMARIASGSNVISLFTNWAGAAWTNANTKVGSFGMYFRI